MEAEKWWDSQTFKTLVVYFFTLVLNAVARKYGPISLDINELAALTVAVVGFIAGRQWKQGKMLDNGIHPAQVLYTEKEAPKPSGVAKSALPLLLVLCLPALSGCAWWQSQTKLQADLKTCVGTTISGEVNALLGEVIVITKKQPVDWDAHLAAFLAKAGQAGICAVLALADALESGTGGTEVDPAEIDLRAQQAAYLRLYVKHVVSQQ